MIKSVCSKCGKANVTTRYSKTGVAYLANVEVYPSGASYFRSLHTASECEAYAANIIDIATAERAYTDALEAWRAEGLRLNSLIAAKGYDAMADRLNAHLAAMPTRADF